MTSKRSSNVTSIHWHIAFPSKDGKQGAYFRAIDALCSIDMLVPTHTARDERRRESFSRETHVTLPKNQSSRSFWRTRQPKYRCGINSPGRILTAFGLTFEKVNPKYVEALWNHLEKLANILCVDYGILHYTWNLDDYSEHDRVSRQTECRLFFDYYDNGPSGVGARTWFGPELGKKIGEDLLLEAGAHRTDWEGWDLVLLDRPWERSFDEILERHRIVSEIVRRSGVFGDYERFPPSPGPNWTPISRKL